MARKQREMALKLSALKTAGGTAGGRSQQPPLSAPSPGSVVDGLQIPGSKAKNDARGGGSGAIGGTVIGPAPAAIKSAMGAIGRAGAFGGGSGGGVSGLGSLGGDPLGGASVSQFGSIGGSSLLGGQTIGGVGGGVGGVSGATKDIGGSILTPLSQSRGSGPDRWGKGLDDDSGIFGGGAGSFGGVGIWGSEPPRAVGPPPPIGSMTPGIVGGGRAIGLSPASAVGGAPVGGSSLLGGGAYGGSPVGGVSGIGVGCYNSGSSALASMLGIELPTGSGSLREASALWGGTASPSTSSHQPPVGSLGNPGVGPSPHHPSVTPIGSGAPRLGLIGGRVSGQAGGPIPIGGFGAPPGGSGNINGADGGGVVVGGSSSNNNDIALLQSLLPGVHITSGNAQRPAAPGPVSTSAPGGGGIICGGAVHPSPMPIPPVSGLPSSHRAPGPGPLVGVGMGGVGIGIGGLNVQLGRDGGGQRQPQPRDGGAWGDGPGLYAAGPPPGAPAPGARQQQQQRQGQTSIW